MDIEPLTFMFTKLFREISKKDLQLVGGKGASLGEMTNANLPVPPGFVVTTTAYKNFANKQFSASFTEEILCAFDDLDSKRVSVRSSAIAEDSSSSSWAGQFETYLNTSRDELIDRIRDCWNSTKSGKVLAYSEEQNMKNKDLMMAVIVQKMIESEMSGVIFTANPVTGNKNEIMIEAVYGLGEILVQGLTTPNNYLVDKNSLKIKERNIITQEEMIVFKDGKNTEIAVPEAKKDIAVITEDQIRKLAQLAIKIEKHYGTFQDIEWAIEKENIYILQSRPITTL